MRLSPRSVTPFYNPSSESYDGGSTTDECRSAAWDSILIIVMALMMAACVYLLFTSPAYAEEPAAPAAETTPAYVGAEKCKMCHLTQYKTWAATGMAKAYERIKEAPDKEKCVACHTTGYGRPGGFTSVEATPNLLGVQCETCHGPGGAHVALPISQKDPAVRKSTINKHIQDCRGCHSPHVPDKAAAARAGSEK